MSVISNTTVLSNFAAIDSLDSAEIAPGRPLGALASRRPANSASSAR
jgi:hypothetical protein